jgi:LPS O-antigen subunit length determinant protein (WzzB/FepE family)
LIVFKFVSYYEFFQELHDTLQVRVQQITEETAQLREKLASLWDRLEIDFITRNIFNENHTGIRRSTRIEVSVMNNEYDIILQGLFSK